jgi:hypothetical protein
MKTYRILALATGLLLITYFVYSKKLNRETPTASISIPKKIILSEPPINYSQNSNNNKKTNLTQIPEDLKSDSDTFYNKLALFTLKNNNIHHDEFGNNTVDISTTGFNSQEFVISDAQIYYPTEEQLNNGVNGCVLGGYYVELNSKLNLVIKTETETETNVFSYVCTQEATDNSYRLLQTTDNQHLEQSMAAIINKPYKK